MKQTTVRGIYLFIYWARIKINIHDRWFAKKCEISTMLREYTFDHGSPVRGMFIQLHFSHQ